MLNCKITYIYIYKPISILFCAGMRHENLVCLLGVCKEADADFYMVMELLPGGALNDYLRGREGRTLNTEQLTEIAIEVKKNV